MFTPIPGGVDDQPYFAGYGFGRIVFYLLADNELALSVDPAEGYDLPGYIPPSEVTEEEDETATTETEDADTIDETTSE